MKIKETLNWILDKNNIHNRKSTPEEYQENIDFVHSLGKKCDCVGWSTLDMDEPDADEVLDKIQAFCKENGWSARGYYERTYTDIESDWYELEAESFKDNTMLDAFPVIDEAGKEVKLSLISAYHEINVAPKEWHEIYVPERFRNACIKNNITDVEFCWTKDKGKYEAEQYFYMQPYHSIPQIICDKELVKKQSPDTIKTLGGYLPKIASVFHTLDSVHLQDCYLKTDMPSGGMAYVYCPSEFDFCGRYNILIHKDTVEILIREKALSWSNLTPACLVDECPDGYTIGKTTAITKISKESVESCFKEYEKLKAKGRPEYIVKEKEALKFLRKTKSERKSDFNKALSKKYIEEISDAVYKSIIPYYQVSNGGLLSDEYTFLSYADSLEATKEFFVNIENEELLESKPCGVVIATCADGDLILFTDKEKVVRFSYEAPEIISEWQNIAKFFVEAINDAE